MNIINLFEHLNFLINERLKYFQDFYNEIFGNLLFKIKTSSVINWTFFWIIYIPWNEIRNIWNVVNVKEKYKIYLI